MSPIYSPILSEKERLSVWRPIHQWLMKPEIIKSPSYQPCCFNERKGPYVVLSYVTFSICQKWTIGLYSIMVADEADP